MGTPASSSSYVAPTTRAQVSGHRFLVRRMHHGLVFGDIRMIHDPLARRRRALVFGLVATVLLGLGAGLFAFMNPRPQPGDAPILRASSGQLYVRIDDTVHATTNLLSARLAVGEAADPVNVADDVLATFLQGPAVGISDAPGFVASPLAEDSATWAACTGEDPSLVDVHWGTHVGPAPADHAVLAHIAGADVVVSAQGRRILPPGHTPQGRALRRRLGIDSTTPVWEPSAQLASALAELPPYSWPQPLPEVIDTETSAWIQVGEKVRGITQLQRDLLADLGAPVRVRAQEDMAALSDLDADYHLDLPEDTIEFLDPEKQQVCALGQEGRLGLNDSGSDGLIELPPGKDGAFAARHFRGPGGVSGARLVDTGAGLQVISADGVRHSVTRPEDVEVLGLGEASPAPWAIIQLLPQGTDLDRQHAAAVRAMG